MKWGVRNTLSLVPPGHKKFSSCSPVRPSPGTALIAAWEDCQPRSAWQRLPAKYDAFPRNVSHEGQVEVVVGLPVLPLSATAAVASRST